MLIRSHYSLLSHNTFGIDAHCRTFVEYADVTELQGVIASLRGQGETSILHIGGGSNLLFTRDFDGVILHSGIRGIHKDAEDGQYVRIRAGAGEDWDAFVDHCISHGWYGLENLSLIPGEVGASAVQNIGAYGAEACQFIDTVEGVDLHTGEVRTFTAAECEYAYRDSVFKRALRGRYAITHVVYKLQCRFTPNLHYAAVAQELEARGISPAGVTARTLRDVICEVRRAKLPDPAVAGSAGSFFMNPVVSREQCAALLARFPEAPHYEVDGGMKIAAGWLIQQAGWKGKSLGPAAVWPKQALVLVNHGGATGQDIVRLSEAIRGDVRDMFGIDLHPEANFI